MLYIVRKMLQLCSLKKSSESIVAACYLFDSKSHYIPELRFEGIYTVIFQNLLTSYYMTVLSLERSNHYYPYRSHLDGKQHIKYGLAFFVCKVPKSNDVVPLCVHDLRILLRLNEPNNNNNNKNAIVLKTGKINKILRNPFFIVLRQTLNGQHWVA